MVYLPGVSGPFVLDDLTNILQDPHVAAESFGLHTLADTASRNRAIPRLTFALNYFLAGKSFDVLAFKLTNLTIHLLNAVLVYMLSLLLVQRFLQSATGVREDARRAWLWYLFPFIVALLWTVHPIQLTSVLYVVQRMTSMATLFSLAGLLLFVWGRTRLANGRSHGLTLMAFGVAGGTLLGVLCKENAVLTPFFAALVEMFFFDRHSCGRALRRKLLCFYSLSALLPLLIAVSIVASRLDVILQLYDIREFTPLERLLTQSRVLLFYLGLMVFPNLRQFGLYHDDIAISHGLLTPWTTLGSVVLWLVLLTLALRSQERRPIWVFGLLWFLLGHALESSLLGLEVAYEHRNYTPSFGIFFVLVFYPIFLVTKRQYSGALTVAVTSVVIATLCFLTFIRADSWRDYNSFADVTLRNHPMSYRAHTAAAFNSVAIMGDSRRAYTYYQRAASLSANAVLPLMEMAKLAQGFLARARRLEAKQGVQVPERSEATDPAEMTSVDLQALISALHRSVRERLREQPVAPTTTLALVNFSICAKAKAKACVALLPEVQVWHRIAVDNPRIKKGDRTTIEESLARSFADAGRIDAAAAVIEAAWARSGEKQTTLEALAGEYQRSGDTTMARATLKALDLHLHAVGEGDSSRPPSR